MTPAWVACHGLQQPVRVLPKPAGTAYSPAAAPPEAALAPISLQSLESLGSLLNVLDREAQTLDLSKQVSPCGVGTHVVSVWSRHTCGENRGCLRGPQAHRGMG